MLSLGRLDCRLTGLRVFLLSMFMLGFRLMRSLFRVGRLAHGVKNSAVTPNIASLGFVVIKIRLTYDDEAPSELQHGTQSTHEALLRLAQFWRRIWDRDREGEQNIQEHLLEAGCPFEEQTWSSVFAHEFLACGFPGWTSEALTRFCLILKRHGSTLRFSFVRVSLQDVFRRNLGSSSRPTFLNRRVPKVRPLTAVSLRL